MEDPPGPSPVLIHVLSVRTVYMMTTEPASPEGARKTPWPHAHRSWAGSPRNWDAKGQWQFDFLRTQGLRKHHHVADLGCGPLRLGRLLIPWLDYSCYYGQDIDVQALVQGIKRETDATTFRMKAPEIQLGDFDRRSARRFHTVWCFSVAIHQRDEDLPDLLRWVRHHLTRDSGKGFVNINVGPRELLGTWRGWPVVQRPLVTYRRWAAEADLKCVDLGPLYTLNHTFGDPYGDQQHMLLLTR